MHMCTYCLLFTEQAWKTLFNPFLRKICKAYLNFTKLSFLCWWGLCLHAKKTGVQQTLTATAVQRSVPLLQVAFTMHIRLMRLYPSLHCVQLVPGPWQLKQFSSHLKMDRKTSHEFPLFMSKKKDVNDRFPENTREARRPEQEHHHMNMYEGVRPTRSDASMPENDSRKKGRMPWIIKWCFSTF